MQDRNHSAKVVGELPRCAFTFDGKLLTVRDTQLMRLAFRWQRSLLSDLLPSREAARLWRGFEGTPSIDVHRLADTIKYCDGELKQFAGQYSDNLPLFGEASLTARDVHDFKHRVQDRSLYWGFVLPVLSVWEELFSTQTADSFRILNQWHCFMSHITLSDVDLHSELIDEYVELESVMGSWDYDVSVQADMNAVMQAWLSGMEWSDFIPSHGPGAVAGARRSNTSRLDKYSMMGTDARLDYYLARLPVPLDELVPCSGFSGSPTLSRTSELICVPKSMSKNRTISKEPASLQYFQHGAWRCVDKYLREDVILHGRIDLHDQASSQMLAQRGSIAGEWATIDLSSASDLITTCLVKAVFRGTPLYRTLICLRSDNTKLPNGKVVRLHKFAPMGSDLCFPIMCLVFACICETAIRRKTGHASRINDYRVYGDDIVLRQEYVGEVLYLLDTLHFRVNTAKSFLSVDIHNFREACGGEYIDGVDVTPLRISRRLKFIDKRITGKVPSVEDISGIVKLINLAFDRGYVGLRCAIIAYLKDVFPMYGKLPYTVGGTSESLIYSRMSTYALPRHSIAIQTYDWCCTNFRSPTRFDRNRKGEGIHKQMFRVLTSVNAKPVASVRQYRTQYTSEDVRYFEYWLTLPDRPYATEFGVTFAPEPVSGLFPTRPKWRVKWVSTLL